MAKRQKVVLCDTNVFFQLFRKNEKVIRELDLIGNDRLYMSSVSIGEIYFGMKKHEKTKTKNLISFFNSYYITEEISIKFEQLMHLLFG